MRLGMIPRIIKDEICRIFRYDAKTVFNNSFIYRNNRDMIRAQARILYLLFLWFYYIFKSWKESNNQWRLEDNFFLFI